MTIGEVTDLVETWAPLEYAEDFDNVGLLVGNRDQKISGVLVTLDTLENVVDEAIERKCNLIVSFHPIVFKGLKKLNGTTYVERVVMKALKNDIGIYSIHTALDNAPHGVNAKICEVLGLEKPQILIPKSKTIKKLTTYVPQNEAAKLKEALYQAGAGTIGNYSHCSFSLDGTGSFMPLEHTNPTLGEIGKVHYEKETQINITFGAAVEKQLLKTLFDQHPYEEVAYEITTLDNANQNIGMGMIGMLEKPMQETDFLTHVKDKMRASVIRHSEFQGKSIQKVAVLGGSGAFAIAAAKNKGADAFVTADVKYHQFFEAEGKLLICDIGHFETEQFTKNLLVDFLKKKIPNFAIALSESITNPIKYF